MNNSKLNASIEACEYLKATIDTQSIIGVGTGSTVNFFIAELGKIKNLFKGAVSSSEASSKLLMAQGIDEIPCWRSACSGRDGRRAVAHGTAYCPLLNLSPNPKKPRLAMPPARGASFQGRRRAYPLSTWAPGITDGGVSDKPRAQQRLNRHRVITPHACLV